MGLKPQAQKGTAWANGQPIFQVQSAQIILKKKHAHIINCIYSLSQISFFHFLYLCLFSAQLIILEVQLLG